MYCVFLLYKVFLPIYYCVSLLYKVTVLLTVPHNTLCLFAV
jgi:hypothetical protein